MKSIILFRHGKSEWNTYYDSDHNRPLAPRGIKSAKKMFFARFRRFFFIFRVPKFRSHIISRADPGSEVLNTVFMLIIMPSLNNLPAHQPHSSGGATSVEAAEGGEDTFSQ